jgi:hypothetical protein
VPTKSTIEAEHKHSKEIKTQNEMKEVNKNGLNEERSQGLIKGTQDIMNLKQKRKTRMKL